MALEDDDDIQIIIHRSTQAPEKTSRPRVWSFIKREEQSAPTTSVVSEEPVRNIVTTATTAASTPVVTPVPSAIFTTFGTSLPKPLNPTTSGSQSPLKTTKQQNLSQSSPPQDISKLEEDLKQRLKDKPKQSTKQNTLPKENSSGENPHTSKHQANNENSEPTNGRKRERPAEASNSPSKKPKLNDIRDSPNHKTQNSGTNSSPQTVMSKSGKVETLLVCSQCSHAIREMHYASSQRSLGDKRVCPACLKKAQAEKAALKDSPVTQSKSQAQTPPVTQKQINSKSPVRGPTNVTTQIEGGTLSDGLLVSIEMNDSQSGWSKIRRYEKYLKEGRISEECVVKLYELVQLPLPPFDPLIAAKILWYQQSILSL